MLLPPALLWTAICSYYTSPFTPRQIAQADVIASGIGLAVLYAFLGTMFAFGAITPMIRLLF